jgi:hypothetical protein
MDNSIFTIAILVSIIFFIITFLENKYLEKENPKTIKILVKETLLVYFSVICGYFVIQQVSPLQEVSNSVTPVFTDNPQF